MLHYNLDQRLPIEFTLLAQIDRLTPDDVSTFLRETANASIEWDRVVQLARTHGVGSMTLAALKGAGALVPRSVISQLLERQRKDIVLDRHLVLETLRLFELLQEQQIMTLVLKGAAVSHSLYLPHPNRRHSNDIDLLVAPHQFQAAADILVKHGYRQSYPDFIPPQSAREMVDYLVHAHTFRHARTNIAVDLHHRLTSNPYWMKVDVSEIIQAGASVDVGTSRIRSLSPQLAAIYLSCHGLGHGFFWLKWIGDAARAFSRLSKAEVNEVLMTAERCGALRHLQVMSRVINVVRGENTALDGIRPAGWMVPSRVIFSGKRLVNHHSRLGRRSFQTLAAELAMFWFSVGLSRGVAAKMHTIVGLLSDPRDTRILKVGMRWRLLYCVVGPVLSFSRFVGRQKKPRAGAVPG